MIQLMKHPNHIRMAVEAKNHNADRIQRTLVELEELYAIPGVVP